MSSPFAHIIVGRVPALPAAVARAIYASPDALGAVRELLQSNADVSAAVRLASPSLHDALTPWLDGQPRKSDRMARKALAYAIRMATRCTPFGLFASSGAVECGSETTLALAGASSRRYRVAPTLAWMLDLLATERANGADTTVIANDLIVSRGNQLYAYHDAHARQVGDGASTVWNHSAVAIRSNAAVNWLRGVAREQQTVAELVERVGRQFDAAPEIAHRLVRKLIEAAVLVPVRPSLQGDPVAYLKSLPEMTTQVKPLGLLDDALSAFSRPGTAITTADIAALEGNVRRVHALDGAVVHVDGFHAFTGTIGTRVWRDVTLLASIALAHESPPALQGFVKQFVDRYEAADRLVPLLELVHEGFTIEGNVSDTAALRRNGVLARMAAEASRERRREVVLTDEQLKTLLPNFKPHLIPNACEIGFQIAARDHAAIATGDYTIVASAALTSNGVAKIASRVAEAIDARFARRIEIAQADDVDDGALDVELDYLPLDARVANLLLRPAWHACAIADASIATPAMRISPADVLIGFADGRFEAYSQSLGKRLRIHESYVFETSYFAPPHIRILSLIANQDRATPKPWQWGAAASHLESLPRVRYGRIVLSPAMWSIPKLALMGDGPAAAAALATWRERWDVPRWLYFTERDMRLLIDLDSPAALALLREQVTAYTGERLEFEEMLPSFDELWLEDPSGQRYAHELVGTVPASVPARRRKSRDLTLCDAEQLPAGPGGEWTYVKLYAAQTELDALIRDQLGPLVAACADVADLDRWFFLRYHDPQHHLRVRLRSKDGDGSGLMTRMTALLQPLLMNGTLRRYAFDTYQPELERYGGMAALIPVQRLFRRDSERVIDALAASAYARDRIRIALRSAAPFVTAWFRRVPAESWLDYHAAETRAEKDATDYALVRELDTWLVQAEGGCDEVDDAAIAELAALHAAGCLTQPVNAVFSAILNMHFTRTGVVFDDEPAVRAHVWRAVYGRTVRSRSAAARGSAPVAVA